MPEIAEIARIVHFLRQHLLNRTIATVHAIDDAIVFDSKPSSPGPCTGASFATALTNRKVTGVKQQGKYFWIELSGPGPQALMHFGMTGWIFLRVNGKDIGTPYWAVDKQKDEWPPKFEKFRFEVKGEPKIEASFVDARRLGRVRLIDVPAEQMRKASPLKENGPDPVIDKDVLTREWLGQQLAKKKVPIKAWLLDQGNVSGVGNWVGDEILWHARIHPEQYCNTLNGAQVDKLFEKLMYVCDFACSILGEKDKFPEDWLFLHRKAGKVPSGEKITLLKVGGRTSAVVPSLQKKTAEGTSEDKIKAEPVVKAEGAAKGKPTNGEMPNTSKKRKADAQETKKLVKKEMAEEKPASKRRSTRTK